MAHSSYPIHRRKTTQPVDIQVTTARLPTIVRRQNKQKSCAAFRSGQVQGLKVNPLQSERPLQNY